MPAAAGALRLRRRPRRPGGRRAVGRSGGSRLFRHGSGGGPPTLPDAGLHPAEEKPGEDPEIAARRELAREYLDRDAAELIEALGEPLERNYAPSCLGGGEDGELVYEGFTVYTYREGDRETVTDVS